jgi:hypothetical protein
MKEQNLKICIWPKKNKLKKIYKGKQKLKKNFFLKLKICIFLEIKI